MHAQPGSPIKQQEPGHFAFYQMSATHDQDLAGAGPRSVHAGFPAVSTRRHRGLVGLVGIGQQYEELQNIAVDFQLNSREIVDNVPELLGDKSRPLDRSINRIQRDRRVKLTQPLNVFSDLFLVMCCRGILVILKIALRVETVS